MRSPAGGDNLYLASIVALNAETGEYVWHYQETPGDNWDYTATQPMILADLKIDGKPRKVILHAPKNGFFFVIDRTNGKLISAEELRRRELGHGLRRERPADRDAARAPRQVHSTSIPGPFGAHNWQPMSFNPQTGLVYLPAQNVPLNLMDDKEWEHGRRLPGRARLRHRLEHRHDHQCQPPKRSRSAAWSRGIRSRRRKPGASSTSRRGTAAR